MNRNKILNHSCWASVALAAYWLGSLNNREQGQSSASTGTATADGLGSMETISAERTVLRGDASRNPSSEIAKDLTGGWAKLALQAVKSSNPIDRRFAFGQLLEGMTPENALAIREELVALDFGNLVAESHDGAGAEGAEQVAKPGETSTTIGELFQGWRLWILPRIQRRRI